MAHNTENLDLADLLEEYRSQNNMWHDDLSMVRRVTEDVLGYYDMNDFLRDNPGACEALMGWVAEQNIPEWKEKFEDSLNEEEEEDDEDPDVLHKGC